MASFQRHLTFLRYLLSEYKGRFPESTCSGLALKPLSDEAGTAEGSSGRWQKSSLLLSQLLVLILVPPASSPFVVLVELFARWHGELGWWLDPDGKKNGKKVAVVVGLYFQMDLLSSVVYHVATNTWTSTVKRLVQGENKCLERKRRWGC